MTAPIDAGSPLLAFTTLLPAVPAQCGDVLVLQVTAPDAGELIVVSDPSLTIP